MGGEAVTFDSVRRRESRQCEAPQASHLVRGGCLQTSNMRLFNSAAAIQESYALITVGNIQGHATGFRLSRARAWAEQSVNTTSNLITCERCALDIYRRLYILPT